MLGALEGVAGWSHGAELWEMHEAVRAVPPGPVTAVEIGSYQGRSAIALALGIAARGQQPAGEVIAVDPHARPGQYEIFLENLERAGVRHLVRPLRMPSHDARPSLGDEFVSVLFIDGLHTHDAVVQDIRDWESALVPRALVAFNDPWLPGVAAALREVACSGGGSLRNPRWISNTVYFDYAPHEPWTGADDRRALRMRRFLKLGRAWKKAAAVLDPKTRSGSLGTRLHTLVGRRVVTPMLRNILPFGHTAADWGWLKVRLDTRGEPSAR